MASPFRFSGGFLRLPSIEKKSGVLWAATARARGDMKDPAAFRRALKALGAPAAWAGGRQVHGKRVLWTRRPSSRPEGAPGTDGTATDRAGLALRVFAADCAPVLLTDGRALAHAHAGWRGARQGILGRALAVLKEKTRARPAEMWMIVGPCIHPCCYEVGPEVAAVFSSVPGAARPAPGGKFRLDLPAVLRAQAVRAGIPARRLFIAPFCTACDRRFFSFRRDKTERRMAAVAVKK